MALQEPVRSTLFTQFEGLFGTEGAVALMAQFPTYEISDVVTVDQLDHRLTLSEQRMSTEMNERFAAHDRRIDARFSKIDERLAKIDDRLAANDLDHQRFIARFDRIDEKLDGLAAETARLLVAWCVPTVLTIIGLVFGGIALLK